MNTGRALAVLAIGMAFIALVSTAGSAAQGSWLATGTVTKINGHMIYMLGKDNNIYQIDASNAVVLISGCTTDCYDMTVGDTVRVFGEKCAPRDITAKRIRVYRGGTAAGQGAGPGEKVINIVVEKEAPVALLPTPSAETPAQQLATWEGKGVITDIKYPARQINIQTSKGNFTVNTSDAQLTNGNMRTTFGALNIGDTVQVVGNPSGAGQVDAQEIKVLRTQYEAENALPQHSVSMAGTILQVDYASKTFKMQGQSYTVVVSVDDKTVIQDVSDQEMRVGFDSLKPSMRVKMSGYGTLASGFAAHHIQIISTAP